MQKRGDRLMPTTGKLYLYTPKYEAQDMVKKLENYNKETRETYGAEDIALGTRIMDVKVSHERVMGLYEKDAVDVKKYRGEDRAAPYTQSAKFIFFCDEERPYLVVLGNKGLADTIANELSILLHEQTGHILEPILNLRGIRELYESGEATKVIFFDDVEIPNLDKATIYGTNLIQTDFYGRFIDVGNPWWVIYKHRATELVVGIHKKALVCIFSSCTDDEYLEYVTDNVIPLVLHRHREEAGKP